MTVEQLGPHRLETLIGSGAMGEGRYHVRLRVFLCQHAWIGWASRAIT